MSFAHLHVHSQFSLLDGTASPGAIAKRAAELGMPAVALTDTCNLYGAVAFYKACRGAGVHPVLGAEVAVQPEGVGHQDPQGVQGGYQVVLLVEDPTGYRNLCHLITRAIYDGMYYRPRIDLDLLRAHRDGLIVLTGGRKGVLGRALAAGRVDLARERLVRLREVLRDDQLHVELQDLGLDGGDAILEGSRTLAAELGLDTVITNAVHYLDPVDAPVHDVLHAIAQGCSVTDPQRFQTPTDQAWFKPEDELRALFPDDGDALDRTVALAERCRYDFDFSTYHFPATTPPDHVAPSGPEDRPAQPDTDAN